MNNKISLAPPAEHRDTAYFIFGHHGGYFLTDMADNCQAITQLAELIAAHPDLICSMDFEAYTLDRMANGAHLEVEEATGKQFLAPDTIAVLRELVQAGRLSMVSTYTQPLLFALDGESVVRQFTAARRVVREVLGISLDAYGTQEPCWCGQLPAILTGCGFAGALFTCHWALFGLPPVHDGEKLRWRGPDGSSIPVIPLAPYAKRPDNGKPYGFAEDGNIFANRWAPALEPNAVSMQLAMTAGVQHPVFSSLSGDFYTDHVQYPAPNIPQVDISFITIPKYLELAQDNGVWDDAFAEFKSYLCWGTWGGEYFRDSHRAANMTVLAERLEVMLGKRWDVELADLRVLAMLTQHHDAWVCPTARMGQWRARYSSLAAFIGACREEMEQKLATMLPRVSADVITLANVTQRRRREWTPVSLPLAEKVSAAKHYQLVDAHGKLLPSRLTVTTTKKADEISGYLLADIPAFASAQYTLVAGTDDAALLPLTVTRTGDNAFTISNERLTLLLGKGKISLLRDNCPAVADVYLDAHVNGAPSRGVIHAVWAEITEQGIAQGIARGRIANIPFDLIFEIKPYSDTLDIRVNCQFNGELIEGWDFSDLYGTLKLWIAYPQVVTHLSNQAFELRTPSSEDYWAVHYSLAEYTDGNGGCIAIHDRPSGVIYAEKSIGITLCHSGNHPYGINSNWMRGFGEDRVYGERSYETTIFPFNREEKAEAVWKYQTKAYPLTQLPSAQSLPLVDGLDISGSSVVTGLYRQGDNIFLRLWNPLAKETARISAANMTFATCDLEGNILDQLGENSVEIVMEPMQICTLLLRRICAGVREE